MKAKIVYPSPKDLQSLYSKYSTIASNNILYEALVKNTDPSFLTTLEYANIHEAYNKIFIKYYPNEISVKSNFVNKVLLRERKQITIFELPIGSSRVDLCKINGNSIAYEIKTDLDNFSRLTKQLNDYLEIFDEVYVICSESQLNEAYNLIPDVCGIYTYSISKRGVYHFTIERPALTNLMINAEKQLRLLRYKELLNYFKVTDCSAFSDAIKYIMENYDSEAINKIFKAILKDRYKKRWYFLKYNHSRIYEIDYQWFYKNQISPDKIYQ